MSYTRLLLSLATIVAISCTTTEQAPVDTAAVADTGAGEVVAVDSATPGDTSSPAGEPSSWTVTAKGIGPISAGMTVAEASAAAGNSLVAPAAPEECDWARLKDGSDGLLFMIQNGKISRVDVTRASTIATAEGARIGDTEDRIKSLYPGVAVQPHAYTDGHYLVVTPAAAAEKDFRLVFETDGSKVLRYRSGMTPAVEYVEGCS